MALCVLVGLFLERSPFAVRRARYERRITQVVGRAGDPVPSPRSMASKVPPAQAVAAPLQQLGKCPALSGPAPNEPADGLVRRIVHDDAHTPSLGRRCGFGEKKSNPADRHRYEDREGPSSPRGDGPRHPRFGRHLPAREKRTPIATAERDDRCRKDERSPPSRRGNPHRGATWPVNRPDSPGMRARKRGGRLR